MHSLERTFHRCFLPSFNLISKGDNIKSYPSFNSLGKSYLSFNRGEEFLEINQKQELPVAVMFVNGSGRNEHSL